MSNHNIKMLAPSSRDDDDGDDDEAIFLCIL